jgi:hypothetical protein
MIVPSALYVFLSEWLERTRPGRAGKVQVRLEENQWRFADPSSQASPGLFQADIVRSFMGKSVLLPCNTYIS